jgi:hypothetical protein
MVLLLLLLDVIDTKCLVAAMACKRNASTANAS